MAGQPTKYKPDFHPQEMLRLMKEQGYWRCQLCRDWDIDDATFQEWLAVHPLFSSSYTRGKQYRKAWMLDQQQRGLFHEDFNDRVFGAMMKWSGESYDERIVKLPELAACKTFSEQATCIIGALACGKITLKEANGYVDVIGKISRIDEVTELRRMLEEIESARKQGR